MDKGELLKVPAIDKLLEFLPEGLIFDDLSRHGMHSSQPLRAL